MSALASMVGKDFIKILTDGAIYTPDGVLVDVRRKVWTSEVVPLAVTGRGATDPVEDLATGCVLYADAKASFDEAMQRVQEALDRGAARLASGQRAKNDVELVFAGYSETEGFVQYLCASHDRHAGLPAWKLQRADDLVVAGPVVSPAELRAMEIDPERLRDADFFDRHGADILEVMRKKKGPNPVHPELSELYGIGGQCDLTTITAEGATTRTLRTWPDKIGERIDPFSADVVQLVTRQQRRAAERAAKKAAQRKGPAPVMRTAGGGAYF
jgi:hypothetical protein